MARDTKWCQNPKCPEKKNSNQIRGSKGNKYYISNKANGYGNGNFCTLGCYDAWSNIYLDRAIDAIGVRIKEPVKVNMENAWFIDCDYQYNSNADSRYIYFLINKLYNVRHPITQQQATNPQANNNSYGYTDTKTSAQAKELAQQLGLTQQQ
tara:strand:+ start:74 stop:529 length:456 start_codon:yes stop_codon:yes gene_type:complete